MTKRKLPIQIRFLLINMLFLFPISLLGIGFYLQSSRIIKDNLFTQTQDILNTQEIILSRTLNRYHSLAEEILYDSGLVNFLENSRRGISYWGRQDLQLRLSEILQRHHTIYYMAINRDGHKEWINKSVKTENQVLFNFRMITLREIAQREKDGIWMEYFETDRPLLYYRCNIYSLDMRQTLGTLELVFEVGNLLDEMDFLLGRFHAYYAFGNAQTGRVLRTSLLDYPTISEYLKFQPGTSNGVFHDKRRKQSISYHSLPYQDWRMMLVVPDEVFFSPLKGVRILAFLVFFLFLLFCSYLLFWVSRNISKPLKTLSSGILRFEKNPGTMELPSGRKDEFGLLLRQFNCMSQQLDRYINRDLKGRIRYKEAELKALQAQIKPHFLFNTLETMNWMALIQGQKDISEMILSLSSLLDAGLGRKIEEYTLKDEVGNLQKFVFLYSKRFEGEIFFHTNLPEEYKEYPIPPLLLQPLVENALSHNRVVKQPKLQLELNIYQEEDQLKILVSDNGQGICDSLVRDLNRALKSQKESWEGKENRRSLGMMNVNLRTKLFYGKEFGLSIPEEQDSGASILLTIPYPWVKNLEREETYV